MSAICQEGVGGAEGGGGGNGLPVSWGHGGKQERLWHKRQGVGADLTIAIGSVA